MKINKPHFLIFQGLNLILILALSIFSIAGQSENSKDENNSYGTSLQGLTEAIIIDGQPALRILAAKVGSTEVKLQKRDGEDALVFSVVKLLNKIGTLYVTKSKIIFMPDSGNKNYFSIEKQSIKKAELVDRSKFFAVTSLVNIVTPDDTKQFTIRFTGYSENNKSYAKPANNLLLKSITNFDEALSEFQQLTASLRQNEEDDEETEEETEATVNDKYDRFKELTIVSTSKMIVRGNKRNIRTFAEYSFAGKKQTVPEKVLLYFYASATRPVFREDDLELNFLVDDKRVSLGMMKFSNEEKTKTTTNQTVVITIPLKMFEQIANGKKVEFQIGTLEYKLSDVHLETFRNLIAYKIEE